MKHIVNRCACDECILSKKPKIIRTFGNQRENGKPHDDWRDRYMTKTCKIKDTNNEVKHEIMRGNLKGVKLIEFNKNISETKQLARQARHAIGIFH